MSSSASLDATLVLPECAIPATEAIQRRHAPTGKYESFKGCLRWEFCFSCAICLVHEADLAEHGADGSATTSIEHRNLQSTTPSEVDSYENCLFVCRYCNGTRSSKPLVDKLGRTLLDPTAVAWGDHFAFHDHELEVISDSAHAQYTSEAYGVNKPRTRAMRENRERALTDAFAILSHRPQLLELLERGDGAHLLKPLQAAIRRAETTVRRFLAVPFDAPSACSCGTATACCLSDAVRKHGRTPPEKSRTEDPCQPNPSERMNESPKFLA